MKDCKIMLNWIRTRFVEWRDSRRWSQLHRLNAWADSQRQPLPGMRQYWDLPILAASRFSNVRIIVDSEEARQQMLMALRYIHDLRELDTDYIAVNYLVHLYEQPELVEVRPYNVMDEYPNHHPVWLPTEFVNEEVADFVSDLEPFTWFWYFSDPWGQCRFYFADGDVSRQFQALFSEGRHIAPTLFRNL